MLPYCGRVTEQLFRHVPPNGIEASCQPGVAAYLFGIVPLTCRRFCHLAFAYRNYRCYQALQACCHGSRSGITCGTSLGVFELRGMRGVGEPAVKQALDVPREAICIPGQPLALHIASRALNHASIIRCLCCFVSCFAFQEAHLLQVAQGATRKLGQTRPRKLGRLPRVRWARRSLRHRRTPGKSCRASAPIERVP